MHLTGVHTLAKMKEKENIHFEIYLDFSSVDFSYYRMEKEMYLLQGK